jgi:integrase
MGRENSPHVVGPFWLDRRPDGASPLVWQIATYDAKARTVRYRSTRCREIGQARDALDAHYASEKAAKPQTEEALVVPQLILYWREHGRNVINTVSISTTLRQFIAFLFQDRVGPAVTFAELRPDVFARFKAWRMKPHGYSLEWEGRTYAHQSAGVVGESVQRDLNTIRAALNHSVAAGRVPFAPKVKGMKAEERSGPRERVLSVAELGAMLGYATSDPILLRFIVALIATAARPVFDTHPIGLPRTKKRNPVIPVPLFWRDWLREWIKDGEPLPRSMRTRWWTMERALGLGPDLYAKTIRHTVATHLRASGVPWADIEGQLGHSIRSQSDLYAKYAPGYLASATAAIDSLWIQALSAARDWLADHMRTKVGNGPTIVVDRKACKC